MNLYIMRHGMAEPYHTRPDAERSLVAEGEAQALNVASQWQAACPALDAIVASPYKRAQQTATIVKDTLGFSEALLTNAFITPDGDAPTVVQGLDQYSFQNILLVSHMPLVSHLLSYLTVGDSHSYGGLQTAQLVHLSGEHLAQGCMRVAQELYPQ